MSDFSPVTMHPVGPTVKVQMVLKLFALSSQLPEDMKNKSCLSYLVQSALIF